MTGFNVRVREIKDMLRAKQVLREVGADETGQKIMAPKAVFRALQVENLPPPAANVLKQEMLSLGGEAGVHRGVINCSVDNSSALLLGTIEQFKELSQKLSAQPFGLKRVAEEIEDVVGKYDTSSCRELDARGKKIVLGEKTLIMGILNVTPDSFSDGGEYLTVKAAVHRAKQLVEEGADIIDVGAESTRPGHVPITAEEELNRLVPVLTELLVCLEVPISVDTHKAQVAQRVLEQGVHVINDVWGLKSDPCMAEVISDYGVPVVVMHNQNDTEYEDVMGDIISSLRESISLAVQAGIPDNHILIDPGIGFGKTYLQNLEVMKRLRELRSLGKPILLGTSRKSFIGKVLDKPEQDRIEGTAATVAQGISRGADIVRVHDVAEMARVARMMDAMIR